MVFSLLVCAILYFAPAGAENNDLQKQMCVESFDCLDNDISASVGNNRKLIQLQILFRHGMRVPEQGFPKDPNPKDVWRDGLGQLTLYGKFQMYALGEQLRQMYSDFITPSPIEIEVLSSSRQRCMESAQCLASALTKPDEKWEFVPGLPWQPIPVLYAAYEDDPYLSKNFVHCPAAHNDLKKTRKSEEGKQFMKDNKAIFEFLNAQTGMAQQNWHDVATLNDILKMHKTYNHIIPDWANEYWDDIQRITDASFYFFRKTPEYQRLKAGPLLKLMKSKMVANINGNTKKKLHLYSGHSKNVVAALTSLGVFNDLEPPFCASLIIELYEEANANKYSVRLLYLNSTTPENGDQKPHVLQLPYCGEYCPYVTFKNRVNDLMPLSLEEECHNV